ncbi:tetratricopeptide repeat protein [Ruixingdingia sedimenti]|uniref:Tetratricopeptide repeat protein n=1 Tax=Ruixingdingia sedimenti TaxID=3073604 RepID=A0ABU1F2Q4_9RHOB|nr:tetratricopeptide repeat protein [Xinfangfangia sp. LG-4]MDR5651119.1 hypothetical protein [Xinfangfangia sp. LG-4]
MVVLVPFLNRVVAAVLFSAALSVPAPAQDAPAPVPQPQTEAELLADLARPDNRAWRRTQRALEMEWGRSGSAAMDLLLQRGRDALADGDPMAAIEHLTALTDHAPDFAEGWNARAAAFFAAGYYGPAIDDIARALTLNPHHFMALAGLGAIREEAGQDRRALDAYLAALAIHPHLEALKQAVARLKAKTDGLEL